MTGNFNHRRSSLLLVGLSIAVFLTTSLLIVNGQGYYNPYPYNDPQAAFDHAGTARANQMLYNYDSSDWEYWANLWLNAPY
jgi:hypothetical protein